MLPVSRPSVGNDELEEIRKVFETGWLGLGSTVFEFETQIKNYLGGRHVIAVNTGTSAIHLALEGHGIGPGDEVIVPSLTFCATIQAIVAAGATPVFCEARPQDLNIDIDHARSLITSRTKAILCVHYCGNACDMDELLGVAKQHGILVIEDAAHAFGTTYKGKRIGSFGDVACFSFDPIKILTTGEGGAVVLADDAVAEEIRRKRILGIDKDTWHRYRNERSWFYEVTTQGYRYHMSNINAAIGLAQLRKFDGFLAARRRIVKRYNTGLTGLAGVELLVGNVEEAAPFTYIVRVTNGLRDQLMESLKNKGVGTGVHYIPNHLHPFFEKYKRPLPVTDRLWKEILTLPLFTEMTDADVDLVISALRDSLEQ